MIDYSPLLKAVEMALEKADADLEQFLRSMGYKNPAELVDVIERIQDDMEATLSDYLDRFESAIAELDSLKKVQEKASKAKEDAELKSYLSDLIAGDMMADMMTHLDEYLKDDDPDLSAVRASEKCVARILQLADLVADTKVDGVNRYIDGVVTTWNDREEGAVTKAEDEEYVFDDELDDLEDEDMPLGKRIVLAILTSSIFERIMDCRGTATTATLSYQSIIQQEAIDQNPSVVEKQWVHNSARHPRPHHVALDGVTCEASGYFELEGADGNTYYVEYPRASWLPPGEVVHCHCTVESIVDDDLLSLDIGTKQQLQADALDVMDEQFEETADPSLLDRVKSWLKTFIAEGVFGYFSNE